MSKTAILSVRILSDAKGASKGFDNFASKLDKLESRATKLAGYGTIASGAMAGMAASAVKAASEMQQSTGAVEAVFKGQADTIKQWADRAANDVGLAASEYQNLAALLGSQLKNMGIETDQLAPKANELIKIGADLSATYGGTAAEAVEALSSALKGEYDPMERYGLAIKKSDINARLAAEGLDKLEGEARKSAETNALLAMINEQSGDALGMFAKEADTAAGQAQRMTASFENSKAKIGEGLLPVVTMVAERLAGLATVVGEHPRLFYAAGAAIFGFTGAMYAIVGAIKLYRATVMAFTATRAVFTAVHSAMAAAAIRTWIVSSAQAVAAATRTVAAWIAARIQIVGIWLSMAAQSALAAVRAGAAWALSAARAAIAWIAPRVAMIAATAATYAMTAAQWLLNAALNANPIGLVVVAVAALAAGLVMAYRRSETFRNAVQLMGRVALATFRGVASAVMGVVRAVGNLISRISSIRWPSPPKWVSRFFSAPTPNFTGVPGMESMLSWTAPPLLTLGAAPPDLTAAAVTMPNMPAALASGSSGGNTQIVNINVDGSGIVDPRAVADAIRAAIKSDGRARGLSIVGGGI